MRSIIYTQFVEIFRVFCRALKPPAQALSSLPYAQYMYKNANYGKPAVYLVD